MEQEKIEKQQMIECKGDCFACRKNTVENRTQWQYCASQHIYNTMRMIEAMQASMASMSGTIAELSEKIASIQDCEAHAIAPSVEEGVTEQQAIASVAETSAAGGAAQ